MGLTKFNAQPPPQANVRVWAHGEFRKIDISIAAIILLLAALEDKPIEVGPPDSGGLGFRALRIPN